jgi:hypothetical protein
MLTKSKILCKRGWKLMFWKHHDTWILYGLPFWNKLQLFRRISLLLFSRKVECISEIYATNYVPIRGATDWGLNGCFPLGNWPKNKIVKIMGSVHHNTHSIYLFIYCRLLHTTCFGLKDHLQLCSLATFGTR